MCFIRLCVSERTRERESEKERQCMCVCVCVRERERDRDRERVRWRKVIVVSKQRNNILKYVNNCFNTKISSSLETSGGLSPNLYINVVYFFNSIVY